MYIKYYKTRPRNYDYHIFCFTHFWLNIDIVGKNLIIVLVSSFDKFQNYPKMV